MKRVIFSYPHYTGGYGCSEPGNNAGEYVLASDASTELARVTAERDELRRQLDRYRAAEQIDTQI